MQADGPAPLRTDRFLMGAALNDRLQLDPPGIAIFQDAQCKSDARDMTEPLSTSPPSNSADQPAGIFRSTGIEQSLGTYLPATAAVRVLNFARVLLLTWTMTRTQFGLLAMVLLVVNVLTPLCSLGLNEAVARYVPQQEQRGSLAAFMGKSFAVLLVVTAGSVALLLLFAPKLADFFFARLLANQSASQAPSSDALQLARLTGVVIALLVVYFYLLSVVKGLRMFSAMSRMELSHSMLFLAGSGVVIVTGRLNAVALTAVYALSLAVPIAYFAPRLIRRLRDWPAQSHPLAEPRLLSKLLKFSIWTMLAGVTWQVLLYYPAWFLNKVHGHEAVAVFAAVRQVGQFALIAAASVATVVITTVTNTWESRGRPHAERQLSLAFRGTCFALLIVCIVAALSKGLIILMFDPAYAPGASILPLQLLFFLLAAYLAFLPGHFHLQEKTRYMFWPLVAGVAGNVLLAYWLAGPRPVAFPSSGAWHVAAEALGRILSVGLTDAQGLSSAAWCGVLAMGIATGVCVLLVRAKCSRLDRGSYLVIAACVLLVARPWIMAIGGGVLILIALGTEFIFTADERRRIIGYMLESLRNVPVLRRFTQRAHR